MPRKSDKKEKLLSAARQLFHDQGFANTTLSVIAKASGVPLGNVYYYFKTKQELILAVIDQKKREYDNMFELWSKEKPKQGLTNYIERYEQTADVISDCGCPDGGLSLELNKESSILSEQANQLFTKQLEWITERFSEIGRKDSRKLALHMMTSLQGSSLLSASLKDKKILLDEILRLKGLVNKI